MRVMRSLGASPMVLAPEKRFPIPRWGRCARGAPAYEERDGVSIYHPRYLSFSNKKLPLAASTFRWTVSSFVKAVLRQARLLPTRPDICYGHFLYPSGLAASILGEHLGIPAVVALGESSFDHYEAHFGVDRVRADLARFARVVAVSEGIKERCSRRYGLPEDRIGVFPNAVDDGVFYPRPRDEMRRRYGLPVDRPIVSFVGHLVERKGPLRVVEAIRERPDIGAAFLGSGPQIPTGPQVLFQGAVPHQQVPELLSAADIFVLPTLAEGSPNAVLEAMACGLPVVSSDRPFNREILDESVAVLVDPMDTQELGKAICALVDNPDRRRLLGSAALQRAQAYTAVDRARQILHWLTGCVMTRSR